MTGVTLLVTGAALAAWGYRSRRRWERGEDPPSESAYTFRAGGRAPGTGRFTMGMLLVVLGIMALLPVL
jgi:hypothetical protein